MSSSIRGSIDFPSGEIDFPTVRWFKSRHLIFNLSVFQRLSLPPFFFSSNRRTCHSSASRAQSHFSFHPRCSSPRRCGVSDLQSVRTLVIVRPFRRSHLCQTSVILHGSPLPPLLSWRWDLPPDQVRLAAPDERRSRRPVTVSVTRRFACRRDEFLKSRESSLYSKHMILRIPQSGDVWPQRLLPDVTRILKSDNSSQLFSSSVSSFARASRLVPPQ